MTSSFGHDDMEPAIARLLDRKLRNRPTGPYSAAPTDAMAGHLQRMLDEQGGGRRVTRFSRMPGGASKEQFVVSTADVDGAAVERMVLRMDPLESLVETSRQREGELLRALQGHVPVPPVLLVDDEAAHFPRPAMATGFVPGVTQPSEKLTEVVSGISTRLGDTLASRLAPEFVAKLAAIHNFDWRSAALPSFGIPDADPRQAALWQVNWWGRVLREDAPAPIPLLTLTENWLRRNAPTTDDLALVHGDYRIGNFMFDEASGAITAVLDWELAHIGDAHEDLAWSMLRLFGRPTGDGSYLVCGLLRPEAFIAEYEAASGRGIDPARLRYYEVLNAWKCAIHHLATNPRIVSLGNNHQDVTLHWLTAIAPVFEHDLVRLLSMEDV